MSEIILAYSDRISAGPGETIAFKVHCERPQSCRYRVVRLICGDDSKAGPGLEFEESEAFPAGDFPGRRQRIECGSHVVVPFRKPLAWREEIEFQAHIWPTLPGVGTQTIASHCDDSGRGLEIGVDGGGRLFLRVSGLDGRETCLVLDQALRNREWVHVQAAYDSRSGRMRLEAENRSGIALPGERVQQAETTGIAGVGGVEEPFFIAARASTDGPCRHFNGKIESPRLWSGGRALAWWDFAADISSTRVTDRSGHGLHGKTVNLPARAVTGHNWTGAVHDWRYAPEQYDAIHFHEDDICDAKWETDFEVQVPEGVRSAIYGAWITGEDGSEHVQPFVVKPHRPSADVVFLLPTASYMAYANESLHFYADIFERFVGRIPVLDEVELFMAEHPEYGMSMYDSHADGSGVCHASRLRPMTNLRFGRQINYLDNEDAGLWQFNADLHITNWLEETGVSFDVITDEDLHEVGVGLLAGWRVMVTGTHPEYWSPEMMAALRAYLDGGGRLMYLGGNGFYWRIEFHPELPGVIELRRANGMRAWHAQPGEGCHAFPPGPGGTWRELGQPPQRLVGVGSTAIGHEYSIGYERLPDSHEPRARFIFDGVGEGEVIGDFGSQGGGAAGIETDRFDPSLGSPPHTLHLASATDFGDEYLLFSEDILFTYRGVTGSQCDLVRADMTFFETESGGAVFSVGSIAWAGSLAHNGFENNVARITGNVLTRFLDPEPFQVPAPESRLC